MRTRASLKAEETWKFMPEQSFTSVFEVNMQAGRVPSKSHVVSLVKLGLEHLIELNASPELLVEAGGGDD